ncbi:MAG: hypothetical protein JNK81_06890 [Anaerolineales bacterium]|nr:hypothetical protein [Anaerolineales bacterium]
MKSFNLFLITSFLLTACATPSQISEVSATDVNALEPTSKVSTPAPTEKPATPTSEPTEVAGPKEGEKTVVKENGYTYEYTYTKIGETPDGEPIFQNVRDFFDFPIIDYPGGNFIGYEASITDQTLGETGVWNISHADDVIIPPNGTKYDPLPITASAGKELGNRFSTDIGTVIQRINSEEGLDLPVILSNGEEAVVNLKNDNVIKMTIMDKDTIFRLGGENVSTWSYGGVTFFSEVYAVEEGRALVRFAIDGSLTDPKLTDEILRVALMSISANLIQNQDQRQQGVTDFAITLGHVSAWTQADDKTLDLEIDRVSSE